MGKFKMCQTSKKCTKCGEIKPLEAFDADKRGKLGRTTKCKECVREKVITEWHNRIVLATSQCNSVGEFKENFRSEYFACVRTGTLSQYTLMLSRKTNTWTKQDCLEKSLLCSTISEFKSKYPGQYSKTYKMGWVSEICKHMGYKSPTKWTEQMIQDLADKCSSRKEFERRFNNAYQAARRRNILDKVCQHMGPPIVFGHTKKAFRESCQRMFNEGRTNGLGLLYLIRCWGNGEEFYKWGITSQGSVKARYSHDGTSSSVDMPYNYEILFSKEGDPETLWELEKNKHRSTKDSRYHPKLWRRKTSKEAFTCEVDSPLLIILSLNS